MIDFHFLFDVAFIQEGIRVPWTHSVFIYIIFLCPRDDSSGALSFTHVRTYVRKTYENFRQAFLRNRTWD